LLPHTIDIVMLGHRMKVLDLAWLIRVKRAAGRPKALEALAELEALQEEIRDS
jgi:predicted nucleotidyltransferase